MYRLNILLSFLFSLNSYRVKDWRVWLLTFLGFSYALIIGFIIIQPTRLWFLQPKTDQVYSEMLEKHKNNVLVYVLDSGVEIDVNPWLSEHSVKGYNAIEDTLDGTEDCSLHGTRVASVVGYNAEKENITVVPVKTAGCSLINDPAAIIRGINWIIDNHPKDAPIGVINISSGYMDTVPFLDGIQNAVRSALDAGFVVVASAGNNSKVDTASGKDKIADSCNEVPANVEGVITVGAASLSFVEGNVQRATFSNSGACVSLFAPGEQVKTSVKDSDGETILDYANGTSYAAPYVSAAVANKLAMFPLMLREEVTKAIKADAVENVIVSNFAAPLEPNVNVSSASKTPNLFLEYDFDKYKSFLDDYKDALQECSIAESCISFYSPL